MKKLYIILLCLIPIVGNAQWKCTSLISFDHPDTLYQLAIEIDTLNYPNNKWQIGKPQKTIFNTAAYGTNAILTDTLNTYPPNDTSVFTLRVPELIPDPYPFYIPVYRLKFRYLLDIDSTTTAKFEISVDSGATWYNTADSFPIGYGWDMPKPDFTISDTIWKDVNLYLSSHLTTDTVLLRFTLQSDTATTYRDGWMIDEIEIRYNCESSVPSANNPDLIALYPNPTEGNIYLHNPAAHRQDAAVYIYDLQGRELYRQTNLSNSGYLYLPLPSGQYTLRYVSGDEYCVKRLLIKK